MSERVYRTMDKTAWGEGPWQDEPDKIQWTDAVTGLPCMAKRNRMGVLCGYVGVAEGHPFFGKGYDDVPLDAHGGLSYADACQAPDEGMTPEEAEAKLICHVPEPGQPDHVWWFGFDCGHGMMDFYPAAPDMNIIPQATYKTLGYVRAQCRLLAAQLAVAA